IDIVNKAAFGNMACLFTSSGAAARKFRYEARVGNIGINVGVAAPMAYFPFTGWKESFFGDLHAQGHDAIDFYTEKKVVVERSPSWVTGQHAVSFFVGAALNVVALDTGAITTAAADLVDPAGGAWLDDGSVLVGQLRGPLNRWHDGKAVPATQLQAGDTGHRFP